MWREILHPYQLAVEELQVKFTNIMNEYRISGLYSPIEQVTGRVKKISSILEKAQRKSIAFDEIEDNLYDIAGIRIICQFVEDIDVVVELIRKRTDMKVLSERDYITRMKDSGYQSYHVIIEYTVQTLKGAKTIPVEIQIRTLAMNFWAIIEHSLQYKYQKNLPEHISGKLMAAAEAVCKLDKQMSTVRSEIMDAQNSQQIKAEIVSDILTNIQNLYHVANKREIIKIQDEFYHVYEKNDIELLAQFGKELDLLAEGYRAQSLQ